MLSFLWPIGYLEMRCFIWNKWDFPRISLLLISNNIWVTEYTPEYLSLLKFFRTFILQPSIWPEICFGVQYFIGINQCIIANTGWWGWLYFLCIYLLVLVTFCVDWGLVSFHLVGLTNILEQHLACHVITSPPRCHPEAGLWTLFSYLAAFQCLSISYSIILSIRTNVVLGWVL